MTEKTKAFLDKLRTSGHYNDQYDYSKVDYVNIKTNFTIIDDCGNEHYQSPSHVLKRGFKLSILSSNNKTEYYIYLSKKIHGDIYDYSLVDYIDCQIKIKIICNKHGIFEISPNTHLGKKGTASRYISGCSICNDNIRYPMSYWTKSRCAELALLCNTRTNFKKLYKGAYHASLKNNWIDEVSNHMLERYPRFYTSKMCQMKAKLCDSRSEFRIRFPKEYDASLRNRWLDDICNHMLSTKKPNGYWSYENCRAKALEFINLSEFITHASSAYNAALKNGWLDEINQHMLIKGSKYKRHVYSVTFDDGKIYFGLTTDYNRRCSEHLSNPHSTVYKYMTSSGYNPKFRLLTTKPITSDDAQQMEAKLICAQKLLGNSCLNKNKGGALGGNIIKWNEVNCLAEASKHTTYGKFQNNAGGAYGACRRNGWLPKVKCYYNNLNESNKFSFYKIHEIEYNDLAPIITVGQEIHTIDFPFKYIY